MIYDTNPSNKMDSPTNSWRINNSILFDEKRDNREARILAMGFKRKLKANIVSVVISQLVSVFLGILETVP